MEKERRESAGVTLSGSGDAKGPFGGVDGVVGKHNKSREERRFPVGTRSEVGSV